MDALFLADRSTMATDLVIQMVENFEIDLNQLHNDSTSVTVTGEYDTPASFAGKKSIAPKHGHSKDHRPDLKQLLFCLTVSRDGAVPVHFKAYDGNVTDDTTHINTWESLRRIVGHSRFVYVADSKLCTRTQMKHIDDEGGKFITIMPKTRSEHRDFHRQLQGRQATFEWTELLRRTKKQCGDHTDADSIYWGYDSPAPSAEGYRIIWILSSQKQYIDERSRAAKITKTIDDLGTLRDKTGKRALKTKEQIEKAVVAVLEKNGSARWFDWQLVPIESETFKQASKGRPGKETQYVRHLETTWTFNAAPAEAKIQEDAQCDGIFPLITNYSVVDMPMRQILEKYKYQPFIEKRHQQMKSGFDVAPVFFKRPHRIDALMFIYFIVMVVNALVERELRSAMKSQHISSLEIYHENRRCEKPTTDRVLETFSDRWRHRLQANDAVVQTFVGKLSPLQRIILQLLGMTEAAYS